MSRSLNDIIKRSGFGEKMGIKLKNKRPHKESFLFLYKNAVATKTLDIKGESYTMKGTINSILNYSKEVKGYAEDGNFFKNVGAAISKGWDDFIKWVKTIIDRLVAAWDALFGKSVEAKIESAEKKITKVEQTLTLKPVKDKPKSADNTKEPLKPGIHSGGRIDSTKTRYSSKMLEPNFFQDVNDVSAKILSISENSLAGSEALITYINGKLNGKNVADAQQKLIDSEGKTSDSILNNIQAKLTELSDGVKGSMTTADTDKMLDAHKKILNGSKDLVKNLKANNEKIKSNFDKGMNNLKALEKTLEQKFKESKNPEDMTTIDEYKTNIAKGITEYGNYSKKILTSINNLATIINNAVPVIMDKDKIDTFNKTSAGGDFFNNSKNAMAGGGNRFS